MDEIDVSDSCGARAAKTNAGSPSPLKAKQITNRTASLKPSLPLPRTRYTTIMILHVAFMINKVLHLFV
jgi:hypothetical protein